MRLPHRYETTLAWPGSGAASLAAEGRPVIEAGAPPEFGGQEAWWTPEHLLLSSLSLCLMTTFEAFARKDGVRVHAYSCRGDAVLNRVPDGLGFTHMALDVTVTTAPEDVDRARDLVMKAKHHCIVARALMPPVHLNLQVVAAPAQAMAAMG